jgi:hypothetical protein
LGNLSTPKSVQKLQTALHAKAKAEAGYRFYAPYDKISREDIHLSISIYRVWFFGFHLCSFELGQTVRNNPSHNATGSFRNADRLT